VAAQPGDSTVALRGDTVPEAVPRRRRQAQLWSNTTDRWSLSTQIFTLLALMLIVMALPVWWLSVRATEEAARSEAIARARSTAMTLAESPWVISAVSSGDPSAALGVTVEQIRADNDLSFIVVMATDGTRWTHPNPDEVGRTYQGTIAPAQAGGTVVEEFDGTLGRSVRVVVPVMQQGKVTALVAAGVSMETLRRVEAERALQLAGITVGSLVLGWLGSWAVTRRIHRQTRGLGPLGLGRLHSYYEALLHSVRAGLVLVGHDGTVVLCNDEARDLLGTPDAQPGSHITKLGLEPDLAALMASGRVCTGETHVAGRKAVVVTQERAVLDGTDLGWVTTLRDRTDLVRLTGELDSLRSFSEMLRSRAHEADNRLHTVIMLVEMGRGEEAVTFATETIEQSQALVDAVTEAVHDAPLAALLLGKSAQAEERGVSLRLAEGLLIPDTGQPSGDLLVVLGNLIDNAVDAAAGADPPRWVEVDGWVDDAAGDVVLEVRDSGPGIPPDLVAAVFQRGWSTKERLDPARPQGRGIGLSLVAGTVRRLAGTIQVATGPSRFVVRLPLPDSSSEEVRP
jgi:sensor histidine kinase regulating citrate/malate metabolism